MKNQTQQNTNTVSRIFVFILGCLLTFVLLLVKYFNIVHVDVEVVFAPAVVITLLTYGDRLLIVFLLGPISFVSKLQSKLKESAQVHQQSTTIKEKSTFHSLLLAVVLIFAGTISPSNGVDDQINKTVLELVTPMFITIAAGIAAYFLLSRLENYRKSSQANYTSNKEIQQQ